MPDGKVVYEIRADDSKLNSDIDQAEDKIKKSSTQTSDTVKKESKSTEDTVKKSTDKAASNFTDKAKAAAKVAATSFAAIGSAAIAIGTKAVTSAANLDSAVNQFAATTGIAKNELSGYEETLKSIYANNYGESLEDIANAMATVTQQIDGLNQADLQNLTESAFALRDTFGYEINESVRAAATMMKQFGIDGDTAMNLIASGAQNGLDFSGELLDSISEYRLFSLQKSD